MPSRRSTFQTTLVQLDHEPLAASFFGLSETAYNSPAWAVASLDVHVAVHDDALRSLYMAIECNACGKPVHETAVRCPHCGDQTGVPVDPIAAAEVSLLPPPPPPPLKPDPLPFDRVEKPKREPRPALPKAIARKRRR